MPSLPKINRRGWLATWLQKRRRTRAAALAAPAPAILLTSNGHGHLTWTLNFTSPFGSLSIYQSADGVTWPSDAFDACPWSDGNRDCSGAAGYFRVCVCDDNGVDVPPYSNVVHSDGL